MIEYAEKTNNCAAAREFKVSEKNVRDWKKISVQLKHMPVDKYANRGKCNKWPQLEVEVAKYVNENRQNGYGVSRGSVRIFALKLARKLGVLDFKASHGWCTRFMKRNDFVPARRTKISQELDLLKRNELVKDMEIEEELELKEEICIKDEPLEFDDMKPPVKLEVPETKETILEVVKNEETLDTDDMKPPDELD